MSKAFAAIGLTGGGVGDLDSIDGALLSAGDVAFVVDAVEKKLYQYTLNSSGTASGTVSIAPASNPGTKTWDLVGAYVKDSITLDDGTQLGYLQFATAVLELYNAKAASGEIKLYAKDGAGNKKVMIACTGGGAVKLYYNNTEQLATSATGLTFSGNLDLNGSELIMDADANTSLTADTDNQIDVKVAGADQFSVKDGVIEPSVDNDIDLGSTNAFKGFKMKGTRVWNGVSQSMSTISASGTTLDITGLTAGYIYEIIYRLYFTGTGKYVYFNFNGDSGSNYKVMYTWDYYNGSVNSGSVQRYVDGLALITPTITAGIMTGVLRMIYGYDNTQVLFDSKTAFYGTDVSYGNYNNSGFYDGAADVTQVTFTTNGTALGGEAIIKRIY